MGVRDAWRGYWFRPASCLNLSIVRILIVGYQLIILIAWKRDSLLFGGHEAVAPAAPLPALSLFLHAVGSPAQISSDSMTVIYRITVTAGLLALAGLGTNLALLVFAAGSLFLNAVLYSLGLVRHPDAIIMIALILLALSPSGRVWSLDALMRRGGRGVRRTPAGDPVSPFGGWALRLIQWMLVLAYLSAAHAKLDGSGLAWMNGSTLQAYVLEAQRWGAQADVGAGGWPRMLWAAASWLVVIFEATFAAVLVIPNAVWVYLPIGVAMHLASAILLKVPFLSFVVLYAVFIPWARGRPLLGAMSAARR